LILFSLFFIFNNLQYSKLSFNIKKAQDKGMFVLSLSKY